MLSYQHITNSAVTYWISALFTGTSTKSVFGVQQLHIIVTCILNVTVLLQPRMHLEGSAQSREYRKDRPIPNDSLWRRCCASEVTTAAAAATTTTIRSSAIFRKDMKLNEDLARTPEGHWRQSVLPPAHLRLRNDCSWWRRGKFHRDY